MTSDVWFSSARIDLTENGLYTVSQGTRNTLQAIPEPITLRFYFSEKISVKYAGVRAYGSRIRDLLLRYESIARGKLKLEIIDPEPLTEQEDLAASQGVTGAPTPAGEKIYFGLVGTNMVSGREVIPFWGIAVVQFVISVIVVGALQHEVEQKVASKDVRTLILLAISITVYGVMWVGKFILFNRVLFRHHDSPAAEAQPAR